MSHFIKTLILTAIFLPGSLIAQDVTGPQRDWWKSNAERSNVENFEEPFQEDIFAVPENENDNFSRNRSTSFSSRGLPSRNNSSNINRRTRPTEFSEKSPKRILSDTEVPVEIVQTEVQVLPNNYSGFLIEIMTSPQELSQDHDIFFRHGNLIVENNNGTFAYLLGKFNERVDAEKFLNEVLLGQYPTAKVVGYQYGQRTN